MGNKKSRTLLVIPEYNDSERLFPFLESISWGLDSDFDVLIVNDGSNSKNVGNILKQIQGLRLKKTSPTILDPIGYPNNRGKGWAIREGFKNRTPEHTSLGFVDADGAVNVEDINKLKRLLQSTKGLGGAFGSRRLNNRKCIKREFKREYGSIILSNVIKLITKIKIIDTQCGLKFLSSDCYSLIEEYLESEGFELDIEICLYLETLGVQIQECPVSWKEIPGSKVKLIRAGIQLMKSSIYFRKQSQKILYIAPPYNTAN
jgi:glycosyltransferase involved in cell wall biosynthesis